MPELPEPDYEREGVSLYRGDCLDVLPTHITKRKCGVLNIEDPLELPQPTLVVS